METTNKNIFDKLLQVQSINGEEFLLYDVDVCCMKAILISKSTNRISIKPITELIVSGPTPSAMGF